MTQTQPFTKEELQRMKFMRYCLQHLPHDSHHFSDGSPIPQNHIILSEPRTWSMSIIIEHQSINPTGFRD